VLSANEGVIVMAVVDGLLAAEVVVVTEVTEGVVLVGMVEKLQAAEVFFVVVEDIFDVKFLIDVADSVLMVLLAELVDALALSVQGFRGSLALLIVLAYIHCSHKAYSGLII
jgi:hypothetical protein